jgi:hypothetical protein
MGDGPNNQNRRRWGLGLLIGGVLVSLYCLGQIAASSVELFGDVMSGGMVPGHGEEAINSSVSTISVTPMFLTIGLVSAVVGLVLLVSKR